MAPHSDAQSASKTPVKNQDKHSLGERIERGLLSFGNAISMVIMAIMLFTTYEVVARYFFNSPTSWVWLVNRQLFAVFALVGGSYAMAHGMHIRIEILMERYSPPVKRTVQGLSLLFALLFLGVLAWQSSRLGLLSARNGEFATGNFRMPLYPIKLFVPLATLLFLLETVVRFFKKKL